MSHGGFVVIKNNHDQVPMSIANVPGNPCCGVCAEDHRQDEQVGYHQDGAGQNHHEKYKHL